MEWFLVLALVAVMVAAGGAWWLRRRRQEELVEDRQEELAQEEWPPDEIDQPVEDVRPQYFDRNSLIDRPRTLDPRRWDNSPDRPTGEPEVEGDLPAYFDRDYLQSRQRNTTPPDD